ncbi:MAG: DUF975 family protein [Clostridia bacterium]|nr:DUF975 family protein [Clostridia bacterium]
MWSRALLKTNAKQRLARYHWYGVLVCLLAALLGASSMPSLEFEFNGESSGDLESYFSQLSEESLLIAVIILVVSVVVLLVALAFHLLVSNPTHVGFARYFISAREVKTPVSELFAAFRSNYVNTATVMFTKDLYVFLWTLLFIIPGIIKEYSYFMVPYLLAENPEMDSDRALQLSSDMMVGHKMELFVLRLSFIGWQILSAITYNILGILYVAPYYTATMAEFYVAVRSEAFARGLTSQSELPFVFT